MDDKCCLGYIFFFSPTGWDICFIFSILQFVKILKYQYKLLFCSSADIDNGFAASDLIAGYYIYLFIGKKRSILLVLWLCSFLFIVSASEQ